MSNLITKTTELALHLIQPYIDIATGPVIDATCGNGHDTLALAEMMFGDGADGDSETCARLIAIDIQPQAIEQTETLLKESGFTQELSDGSITLVCGSHENMIDYIPQDAKASAVVFNLGYLPGGDKSVTTKVDSTMKAVGSALEILHEGGILAITMYSGHEAGAEEKDALLNYVSELDPHLFHAAYISMPNQHHHPPEILLITKK